MHPTSMTSLKVAILAIGCSVFGLTMHAAPTMAAELASFRTITSSKGVEYTLGSDGGSVGVWQNFGENAPTRLTGQNTSVTAIAIVNDELYMVATNSGGIAKVWKYSGTPPMWESLTGDETKVEMIVATGSRLVMLATNSPQPSQVWEYSGTPCIWIPLTGTNTRVSAIAAIDKRLFMTGSLESSAPQIWEYKGVPFVWAPLTGTNTSISTIGVAKGQLWMHGTNGGAAQYWQYTDKPGIWAPAATIPVAEETELFGKKGTTWRVALQAANGFYLGTETDGSIVANLEAASQSGTFDLVHVGEGFFALRSHANDRFVTMSSNRVSADSYFVGDEQRFEFMEHPDYSNVVSLRSRSGFASMNSRDARIAANGPSLHTTEGFLVSFPTTYQRPPTCPEGLQRAWVPADGSYHPLEFIIGTGVQFDTVFREPIGAQVRAQYFITPNGPETTLDGGIHVVHVQGLFGQCAIKVPMPCWVYYSAGGGSLASYSWPTLLAMRWRF